MDTINQVKQETKRLKPHDDFITAKLRAMCREGFEATIPNMIAIAKGEVEDATPALQIRAHDNLGKYAMGPKTNVLVENGEWLKTVWMITARHFRDREKFVAWAAEVNATLQYRE